MFFGYFWKHRNNVIKVVLNVTSFSNISYKSNSEYWSQKQTQSWNIHSIILDVYVGWQSAQLSSFHLLAALYGRFKVPFCTQFLFRHYFELAPFFAFVYDKQVILSNWNLATLIDINIITFSLM